MTTLTPVRPARSNAPSPDNQPTENPPTETTENPPMVRLVPYRSLDELRGFWDSLDAVEGAMELTIVLALRDDFGGYLPDVIRRRNRALRLALTAPSGHLPGLVTIGDLAMTAGFLGWLLIVFQRDMRDAVSEAVQSLIPGESCVVFWPDGMDRQAIVPDGWTSIEHGADTEGLLPATSTGCDPRMR